MHRQILCTLLTGAALLLPGCGDSAGNKPAVGVAFETLQTEYWVASRNAIESALKERGAEMIEAIADGDANKQFEQVQNFITRRVDGIIIVPKDAQTVIPMIRAANQANIPIVLFNRPPAPSDAKSVSVVADNYNIAKATVEYLTAEAVKGSKKVKAAILVGDLGDINSIGRRDGFEDAVKAHRGAIDVVARIPTEWNQEKALAGTTNALQANSDIGLIFVSSDVLLPSVVSALKSAGKYKKVGEPGHVVLGAFDGDATAYRMLVDGYLDADGIQDMEFDTEQSVKAIFDMKAGKQVPARIVDNGLVIHQGNLKEMAPRMWGAKVAGK
jgi:inositol transport system substrate-binding protein